MNEITVFSDSKCDLSDEVLRKFDVRIVPLRVELGKKSYRVGIYINNEQLHESVEWLGCMPKTSSPALSEYINLLKKK